MCELLSMFLVVGAVQLSPNAIGIQILNNGEVEQFVVPTRQYQSCMVEEDDVQPLSKVI